MDSDKKVPLIEILCRAADDGDLEKIKSLRTRFENVDFNASRKNDGATPLIFAAKQGHLPVVQFLIGLNMDVDKLSFFGKGYNALMYATQKGHYAIAEALYEAGANPWLKCKVKNTAMNSALKIAMSKKDGKNFLSLFKRERLLQKHPVPWVPSFNAPHAEIDQEGKVVLTLTKKLKAAAKRIL
jgi:ankyrin repeat protein